MKKLLFLVLCVIGMNTQTFAQVIDFEKSDIQFLYSFYGKTGSERTCQDFKTFDSINKKHGIGEASEEIFSYINSDNLATENDVRNDSVILYRRRGNSSYLYITYWFIDKKDLTKRKIECIYYQNGNMYRYKEMANGLKNGVEIYYRPNGSIQSETYYKNDVKHGLNKDYNKDSYWETEYIDGKRNGVHKYYLRGLLHFKAEYVDGKLNGTCTTYYWDSKKIKETEEYINGKLNGYSTHYSRKNGKIWLRILYIMGERIEYKRKWWIIRPWLEKRKNQ